MVNWLEKIVQDRSVALRKTISDLDEFNVRSLHQIAAVVSRQFVEVDRGDRGFPEGCDNIFLIFILFV